MKSKTVYTEIYNKDTTAEIKKTAGVIFSERRGSEIVDIHVDGLAMIELTGILAENAPQLKTTAALRDAANAVLEEIKERDAERKKR
jgi:hypothetical protein